MCIRDSLCIMQDDGDAIVRDFQRTCSRIIENYYEKLNREDKEVLSANLLEDVENIYGYEPIVLMEMIHQKERLAFKVKGIQKGIPKKNLLQRDAIQLDFIRNSGEKYSLSLPDPTHLHIHKAVSYTHLRAHETLRYLVCRLLLEKKNK